MAGRLSAARGPWRRLAAGLHQIGEVDRAVYEAIASVNTPALDSPVRRLSHVADHSVLWLGIAGGIALTGGPAGRRAAVRGLLALGTTSALVNVGVKSVWARRRPDRAGAGVPGKRHVTMPSSASFPSGHSASAFAFAGAIGRDLPLLALGLHLLAGAVAYSRIHTGVHYPGDTVIGAIIGASTAHTVTGILDRRAPALRLS
ncbi:MAG TPA: phosphatase PAP2 family protein [Actinobacteria bacterium]|nr:phosphatase PAP2 family protein [Actinomycetota bacterium]